MANVLQATPPTTRSSARLYFWSGIGLCLLGPILNIVQVQMKLLFVPWYAPVLATLGVVLMLYAVTRRLSILRIILLSLFGLLCVGEWLFIAVATKLPAYEGPARAGEKLPAFTTRLADGSPLSEKDLEKGQASALVFFRGHW